MSSAAQYMQRRCKRWEKSHFPKSHNAQLQQVYHVVRRIRQISLELQGQFQIIQPSHHLRQSMLPHGLSTGCSVTSRRLYRHPEVLELCALRVRGFPRPYFSFIISCQVVQRRSIFRAAMKDASYCHYTSIPTFTSSKPGTQDAKPPST